MLDQNSLAIIVLLLFNIVFGCVGYMLGRINCSNNASHLGFRTKNNQSNQKEIISINDTKVVTAIKTDNLEKKFETLGDKKQSQENISSAIDKLKSMKG